MEAAHPLQREHHLQLQSGRGEANLTALQQLEEVVVVGAVLAARQQLEVVVVAGEDQHLDNEELISWAGDHHHLRHYSFESHYWMPGWG